MKYTELEKLNSLREKGAITEEEFQREKEKILNPSYSSKDLLGMEEKTYCMLLHLSQFLGFVVPGLGLIAPIVLWAINKDKNAAVDIHGKIIINWTLSVIIYCLISFVLTFILIGIALFIAIAIASIVFIIIGAMKANEGIAWKYPLSIEFLRINPPSDIEFR